MTNTEKEAKYSQYEKRICAWANEVAPISGTLIDAGRLGIAELRWRIGSGWAVHWHGRPVCLQFSWGIHTEGEEAMKPPEKVWVVLFPPGSHEFGEVFDSETEATKRLVRLRTYFGVDFSKSASEPVCYVRLPEQERERT